MKLRTHAPDDATEAVEVPQAFGRVNVLPGGAPPPSPWAAAPEPAPEPEPEPSAVPETFELLAPPDPSQMVPADFAPPSPFDMSPAPVDPTVLAEPPAAAAVADFLAEPEAVPTPVDQLPPPKAAPVVADGPLLPAPNVIPGQPLVVPVGSVTPLPGFLDPSDPAWPTSLPAHGARHLRTADEVAASASEVFNDPRPLAAATAANQAGLVFSDGSGAPADPAASSGLRSLANRMLHRS